MSHSNDDETWTSAIELAALAEWAKGATIAVEVGTWKGRSAEAILQGSTGKLYCVDSFVGDPSEHVKRRWFNVPIADVKAAWRERLSRFGDRVELLEMDSVDAATYLAGEVGPFVDFVFIDACHNYDYVRRDVHHWAPLIRPGGLLCGHDYDERGVRDAVNGFFSGRVESGPEKLWRVRV